MRQRKRFYSLRFLLELVVIPISLIAAYALFVGVTFGFNLWRAEAPLVTVAWLMIVTSPLWFYLLLKWSQTSATRVFSSQVESPDDSENTVKQESRVPVLIPSKPNAL